MSTLDFAKTLHDKNNCILQIIQIITDAPGFVNVSIAGKLRVPELSCQYSANTRPVKASGTQVSSWLVTLTTLQGKLSINTRFCSGAVVLKPIEEVGAERVRGLPPSLEPAYDPRKKLISVIANQDKLRRMEQNCQFHILEWKHTRDM
jgi:hypothetical protein